MRLWLYLSVLLVVVASTCFAAPEITAVPSAPRPGEVIFLTFHPEQELVRAACSWNGRSYQCRFHDADGRYPLALPVSASTRAGGRHATIYWKYTSGEMGQQTVEIEVKPRKFGVQHLRLSSSQESKYTAPETKREKELIGAALDLVSPERLWRGSFVMPVQGRLSTAYGLQRYVNGKFSYRHRGVDIGAPEGTPVLAAADGAVALADDSFLLHGQTIVLDHGQGVTSLYLHLSHIEVSAGQRVAQGQVIGRVGETGVATGPHLHFAVYAYHEAVDPLFWMDLPSR